ncbi:MAG: hypothetical protein JXK05_05970 [Campylobacterales bacterium]|nr:hypothetical protein [Campylobacterales bacterium]
MFKTAFTSFLVKLIGRSHERKTTLRSITKRLLVPFALAALLLSIGVGVLLYWQSHQNMQERLSQKRTVITEQLASLLSQQAMGLGIAAKTVAADPQTHQALSNADIEALSNRWAPLYRELNQTHRLTHFYFFDARRICLLRLHGPQKRGDLINRFTALEAEWRGRASYGLELGPLGTLTLRYVQPIYNVEKLIGYVELGKEIEDLLEQLGKSFGVELMLMIKKSYLNQKEWEAGMSMLRRSASWSEYNDTVLAYASAQAHLQGSLVFNDRHFAYLHLGVFDVALKEIGYLQVIVDVTQVHLNTRFLVLSSVLLALALSGILIGLFYLLLRYTDKALLAGQ